MLAGINIFEHKDKRISAFSLAELMVAIGILGVGMLIIAAAFPVALDQTRQAIELQTSQAVFEEAINKIRTQIEWTDLENYIVNSTGEGANSTKYSLALSGSEPRENRIWILDFSNSALNDNNEHTDFFYNNSTSADFVDYSTGTSHKNDCVYTQDNTYAWLAVCQRLSAGMYKFWIFVVRDPAGIGGTNSLKATFTSPISVNVSGNKISFNSQPIPNKLQVLMGDDGNIYQVTETSPISQTVMCDRNVDNVSELIFITSSAGNKLSRKAPTVWVYQTVINY